MARPFWTYKYTPKEMLDESMEYFKMCEWTKVINWYGKEIQKPKTLTWLASWLWVDKWYISEKLKDSNYSEMIKYIRNQVENDIEEWAMIWAYNATVSVKNLSANFDWKDKSELDQKTEWKIEFFIKQ